MKTKRMQPLLLAITVCAFAACNNGTGGNEKDTTVGNNMADSVGSRMENASGSVAGDVANLANSNEDSSFVTKAMASNTEELILIQTGIDKGTNAQLKSDARKMLADHNKLKTQLQEYASKKGYAAPQGDKNKSSDDLEQLNKNKVGAEWDEAWADQMETEHKDDVDAFEKGERNVKDSSLHTLITRTLPVLQSHLTMAQELKKNLKK